MQCMWNAVSDRDLVRRERASKLADVLDLSPDAIRLMNDAEWLDAASAARVKWPISQETRELVALIKETREETHEDPFRRFDKC